MVYHDTEGAACEGVVFNGDGSEGKSVNVASEDLSDGTKGVVADGGEDGTAS